MLRGNHGRCALGLVIAGVKILKYQGDDGMFVLR